jgi:uncharacterized protein YjbI with pentapeptide repeats
MMSSRCSLVAARLHQVPTQDWERLTQTDLAQPLDRCHRDGECPQRRSTCLPVRAAPSHLGLGSIVSKTGADPEETEKNKPRDPTRHNKTQRRLKGASLELRPDKTQRRLKGANLELRPDKTQRRLKGANLELRPDKTQRRLKGANLELRPDKTQRRLKGANLELRPDKTQRRLKGD